MKHHKTSLVTKGIHAGLLGLALAPRIADTKDLLTGQVNVRDYTTRLLQDYTGYSDQINDFQMSRLARGWGPVVGAIVLGKVIGHLRRQFKI